jgi:hypothetical protein
MQSTDLKRRSFSDDNSIGSTKAADQRKLEWENK